MNSDSHSQPADQQSPGWLHSHSHEPNPAPPSTDPQFVLALPDGTEQRLGPEHIARLPQTVVRDCYIVSTGHGTSGPFVFGGARLADLVRAYVGLGERDTASWRYVDVISADGFGNRVTRSELDASLPADLPTAGQPDLEKNGTVQPILLAIEIDGRPLTRAEGLVRMIVPAEKDDALRQVKWVGRIEVR